jgi:hypothetical protein
MSYTVGSLILNNRIRKVLDTITTLRRYMRMEAKMSDGSIALAGAVGWDVCWLPVRYIFS